MTPSHEQAPLDADLFTHIFSVSSAMVGVCLTVIGLLRVVITLRRQDTIADDLVAVNSILFLVACVASYWALRARASQRMLRLERFADAVFVTAMGLMVATCLFVTYAIAAT